MSVPHDPSSAILFDLETNAMLVSHGGKEHIVNAETKKNNVYVISFSQRQRKKA